MDGVIWRGLRPLPTPLSSLGKAKSRNPSGFGGCLPQGTVKAFLFFFCIFFLTARLFSAERSLAVICEGTSEARPQKAVVSLHFTAYGWSVNKAEAKADRTIKSFLEKLKEKGVSYTSMSSDDIKLKPSYQFNRDLKTHVPSDFLVSRKITLELDDLSDIGKLMDASLSVGSFILESAVLTVEDKAALNAEAFQNALEAGKRKAQGMARAFGSKPGPVLSVEEIASETEDVNLIQENDFASLAGGSLQIAEDRDQESKESGSETKNSPLNPGSKVKSRTRIRIIFSLHK